VGLLTLAFKYRRVLLVLVGFEFLSLGTFFFCVIREREVISLFFLFSRVVSSVFLLTLLLGLVKTYGSDSCLY
jgi:hypothetical protein